MPGFEDYDPPPGYDLFILANLAVGAVIGWLAPEWLKGAALVAGWGLLRCVLAWLREAHLPYLARVMARGEHGPLSPTSTFYVSIAGATVAATAMAAIGGALLRRTA